MTSSHTLTKWALCDIITAMDIKLPYKYKQLGNDFGFWDKVYCFNNKVQPKDFKNHLAENFLNKPRLSYIDDFVIDTNDNKEIDYFFKKMKERAEIENSGRFKDKEKTYQYWQRIYTSSLKSQYYYAEKELKELVEKYPPALRALLFDEFVTRVYDSEPHGTTSTRRIKNKSIGPGLILNDTTINFIMKNVQDYPSFKKLYFAAIEAYKKRVIVDFKLVTMPDKRGKLLMFPGADTDYGRMKESSDAFAAISMGTTWCTKTLAPEYLNQGNCFIFVGNDGTPQILNLMRGTNIVETCGTQPNQQITAEFKPVAEEIKRSNILINKSGWRTITGDYSRV